MLREECRRSLHTFVKTFWPVVEPGRAFVDNWHIRAICEHLEAITDGRITRLLLNVPPGAMKSFLVSVFWPAWEWGPRGLGHLRYLTFSYSEDLTIRDNRRARTVIGSPLYQRLWGNTLIINPKIDSAQRYDTSKMGWRIASSVGGVGTGERSDRLVIDDPHSIQQGESDVVRGETIRWWREVIPTRVNDAATTAFVVVMQRVHNDDVSGAILEDANDDWVHLMIPMRYEPERHGSTVLGWEDPRGLDPDGNLLDGLDLTTGSVASGSPLDEARGTLFWEERFPEWTVARDERTMGPYAVAGQFQQTPVPRGGGIIRREWWQLWSSTEFPDFKYVLASLDNASSERDTARNAYTALTVWGAFDWRGRTRFMLKYAWRDRGSLHEVVQTVGGLCVEHKVDYLLIENKATGAAAAGEIVRAFGRRQWRTRLVTPVGDKVNRLDSTTPMFADGLVWAPDRDWADMVISEVEAFPKSKYADLTDTTSQALRYLRTNGAALLKEEVDAEHEGGLQYRKPVAALYDV